MADGISRQQIEELYLPPTERFVEVDVPKMKFLMVDGTGSPDEEPFVQAMAWIFAVAHPIRRIAKTRMGKHFVEPPLEALWWADDPADFVEGRKDRLKWRLMISATPDWITKSLFANAVKEAAQRLGRPPKSLRLDRYAEGPSVQTMHVGPSAGIRKAMRRLHERYLPSHRLACNGPHHEIYLTDARRVAPARQKTVLRQPVSRHSTSTRRRAATVAR